MSAGSTPNEKHIVVNADRTITVPAELKNIAVQFDNKIETVVFDCPRFWDGNDFNEMHIYINYRCPDGSTGQYLCTNVSIDSENSELIHFDWTISNALTQHEGAINFVVCIKDDENKHWNSCLNNDLKILEGLETTPGIIDDNPDVIEEILARLDNLEAMEAAENGMY